MIYIENKSEYVRVFTFQYKEVVDTLLQNKKYIAHSDNHQRPMRDDKQEFYTAQLGLKYDEVNDVEIYPIYTWYRLGFFHPVSIEALRTQWSELMGYYLMRIYPYLVELYVPKNEGIIGVLDKCEIADSSYIGYNAEFVIPYILPEWVREIYQINKYGDSNCYGLKLLTPLMKKYKDALIKEPIHFKGDSYGEKDYNVFRDTEPLEGFTYADNFSRMTWQSICQFLQHFIKEKNLQNFSLEYLYAALGDELNTVYTKSTCIDSVGWNT